MYVKKLVFKLLILLFGFNALGQNASDLDFKINLEIGGGLLYSPISELSESLQFQSALGEWSPSGGFSVILNEGNLEAIISIQRAAKIPTDGEYMYIGDYSAAFAYRIPINESWSIVPSIGYQALLGIYERQVPILITPGPSLGGNIDRWFFEQEGLMLSTTFRYRIQSNFASYIPGALYLRLQYGLPIGEGTLSYTGNPGIIVGETPIINQNFSLNLGIRYRLVAGD
ncbi:MAG: hypothetical protein NXI09_13225 [Bacteroidetes bacterium]|nr:hypothetical protein [Bacteroidota bacterium]